jgi:hypothetical protein
VSNGSWVCRLHVSRLPEFRSKADLVPLNPQIDLSRHVYVEGLTVLQFGDVVMNAELLVTELPALWAYLMNGIDEMLAGATGTEFYYPDMPVKVSFAEVDRRRIKFAIGNAVVVADRAELFKWLCANAAVVFATLAQCGYKVNNMKREVQRVENINRRVLALGGVALTAMCYWIPLP